MRFIEDDAQEFADLIEIVGAERGLRRSIVEKDNWVTHALWALSVAGFDVWFKGGTSRAKGFGPIERFSEDLDLKVAPGARLGAAQRLELEERGRQGCLDAPT